LLAAAIGCHEAKSGTWSTVGSMSEGRLAPTATRLADGRVLVAGGAESGSADLFDPQSNLFHPTGSLSTPRYFHAAILLADGRVLIAGGLKDKSAPPAEDLSSAELYDPATGRFTATGSMTRARIAPAGMRLPDGRVLIAGGESVVIGSEFLDDAELYDPGTGKFTAIGPMSTAMGRVTLSLVAPFNVLVIGEGGKADQYVIGQSFGPVVPLQFPRSGFRATDLGGGQVFVAGGDHNVGPSDRGTSVFSYQSNYFFSGPELVHTRTSHVMEPLPGGRALLAAGFEEGGGILKECEVCDPVKGVCVPTGAIAQGRFDAASAALEDGRVLLVGGDGIGPPLPGLLASAEVYTP
jgi:hypothetical protein